MLIVSLDESDVVERCRAAKVGISVIEPLPGGGTRLVCESGDGAELMRKKLKKMLISGPVIREAYRPRCPPL